MIIKTIIKNKLSYYPKLNMDTLKKKIDKYDYISFDIYDTLIKRDVENPTDVFKLIDMIYFDNSLKYYNSRIMAEKNVRSKSRYEEITIDEIYDELAILLNIDSTEVEKIKRQEIELERRIGVKNIDMYEIYTYCLKKEKKVVITSNTYMAKKDIEYILKNNDYINYKKLYISSVLRKNKRGTLFDYIIKDLNINSRQIIHIGDSLSNDIRPARKYGILAIKIPRNIKKIENVRNNKNIYIKMLDSFINNRIDSKNNIYYNFGYEKYGKMLFGFTLWLRENIINKNINDLYFLSRDGFILKKCFDIINDDNNIRTHYLEMSRRSTRVPMLWIDLSLENISKSFPSATLTNINVFFDTIGLEINDYKNVLKKIGITNNYTFKKNDILNNKKIVELYKLIKNDIYNNSKQEYDILAKYLEQEIKSKNIAIIDIGWRGSMQKFVTSILKNENKKIDITGYYLGLTSGSQIYKGEITEYGYLFDNFNNDEKDTRGGFVGLFESLFLHNIGSVKKYVNDNGSITPLYYDNEYYENNKLNESIKNIIKIQQGAIDFIRDYNKLDFKYIDKLNKNDLYEDILKSGTNPSKKDILMFANLDFFDGVKMKLANPKSIFYYIGHPKLLIVDFYNSRWKIGFMKKLFKIPFSYSKIYEILKK